MIDMAWYYYQRFALAAAVRDGVRVGVTVPTSEDPWDKAQDRIKADLSVSSSPINPNNITWGPSTGHIASISGLSSPNQYLTMSCTYPFTPLVGFIKFLPTSMTYQMSMLLEVQ